MIKLDELTLPIGLRWADEFVWSPIERAVTYALDGSLIVQESIKQKGRPITLIGGASFSPISRSDLILLYEKLTTYTPAGMTLELHDLRTFQVIPRQEFEVEIYPVVLESGPADPTGEDNYYIEAINLMEI